jgi:hypothetical protein
VDEHFAVSVVGWDSMHAAKVKLWNFGGALWDNYDTYNVCDTTKLYIFGLKVESLRRHTKLFVDLHSGGEID